MPVTISGSGQIVKQVVSTTSTTIFSSSATSPTDITGWTATITPTSTNSKILVIFNAIGASTNSINLYLNRNGTNIALGATATYNGTLSSIPTGNAGYSYSYAGHFLDSPASASAVVYKIQGATDAGTFYVNRNTNGSFSSPATITLLEISGS